MFWLDSFTLIRTNYVPAKLVALIVGGAGTESLHAFHLQSALNLFYL